MLQDSPIYPDSYCTEPHIQISKADPKQTQPRPKHVATIQTTHAGVGAVTGWRRCKLIAKSSNQMPQGMASKCVTTEQVYVNGQHDSPDANAERTLARRWTNKPQRFPNVIRQDQNKQER